MSQPDTLAPQAGDSGLRPPVFDVTSGTHQDQIYATLRQWITVGRFQPGERLKIRTVAAHMGVGQMPVRAALQRLAAEGALINVPHAGVAVPRLSLPEFDDLVQTRMLLEGEAAERGSLRLAPAQIAQLQRWCQQMDDALAAGQSKRYLDLNEDFHVLLYQAAGSPLLFQLIDTLWLRAGPISNRLFDTPAASAVLNAAHDDLVQALVQGDSAAVRRAVERDIFVAGQFLRSTCAGVRPRRAVKTPDHAAP
jgi:DNA-binding GntR family transcriptional regulator